MALKHKEIYITRPKTCMILKFSQNIHDEIVQNTTPSNREQDSLFFILFYFIFFEKRERDSHYLK